MPDERSHRAAPGRLKPVHPCRSLVTRDRLAALAVCLCLLLAGCGGAADGGPSVRSAEERAPAAVPVSAVGTATPAGGPDGGVSDGPGAVTQPRYLSLRPTCERPPGIVIHVQVGALANNDPATDAGIRTRWRFTAPSTRGAVGSYPDFVRAVTAQYGPLLAAGNVTYGPLRRNGNLAFRQVNVVTPSGTSATYAWTVARQSGGRYEGCWMTVSVTPVYFSRFGPSAGGTPDSTSPTTRSVPPAQSPA